MAYVNKSDIYKLFDESNGVIRLHIADVDMLPTADVVEVKHGCWKESVQFVITDDPDDDGYWRIFYICSECERTALNKEPYCHCGAKMDGRKDE